MGRAKAFKDGSTSQIRDLADDGRGGGEREPVPEGHNVGDHVGREAVGDERQRTAEHPSPNAPAERPLLETPSLWLAARSALPPPRPGAVWPIVLAHRSSLSDANLREPRPCD